MLLLHIIKELFCMPYYSDLNSHLFTQFYSKWENEINKSEELNAPLCAPVYENAVLLPLRPRTDVSVQNVCCEGGVCAQDGTFITGLTRALDSRNPDWSCKRGYEIPDQVNFRDETVMYGGVLIAHFGHTLLDSMSRMWWWVKNRDQKIKIVFLRIPGQKKVYDCFLQAAGLSETDWEIIDEPTRFSKLIVPDEAMFAVSMKAHKDWLLFFDLISESAKKKCRPNTYKKIYLTRRQLPESEGVNEEYYEDFYAQRGYKIIAPETLPFEEQINYISNAEEIVCPMGTLSHFAVFAQHDAKLTILLRVASSTILPQIIINRICSNNWYIVEACVTPLPTSHSHSFSIYAPTKYFRSYLDSRNIPYSMEELWDLQIPDALYVDYFRKYTDAYSQPKRFKLIKKADMFDVLNSLNRTFSDRSLSRNDFETDYETVKANNRALRQDLNTARNKLYRAEKELAQIYNSKAWKCITRYRHSLVYKLFQRIAHLFR